MPPECHRVKLRARRHVSYRDAGGWIAAARPVFAAYSDAVGTPDELQAMANVVNLPTEALQIRGGHSTVVAKPDVPHDPARRAVQDAFAVPIPEFLGPSARSADPRGRRTFSSAGVRAGPCKF